MKTWKVIALIGMMFFTGSFLGNRYLRTDDNTPGHLSPTYLLEYHAQPLITGRGVLTLEWAGCDSSGMYVIHFGKTQDWEGSVWGLSDNGEEVVKVFPWGEVVKVFPWGECESDTTIFVQSGAVCVCSDIKPLWVATQHGVAEIFTDCGQEATP